MLNKGRELYRSMMNRVYTPAEMRVCSVLWTPLVAAFDELQCNRYRAIIRLNCGSAAAHSGCSRMWCCCVVWLLDCFVVLLFWSIWLLFLAPGPYMTLHSVSLDVL